MGRVPRLTVVASLTASALVLLVWPTSFFFNGFVVVRWGTGTAQVAIDRGRVDITHHSFTQHLSSSGHSLFTAHVARTGPTGQSFVDTLLPDYQTGAFSIRPVVWRTWSIPLWMLLIGAALPGAIILYRRWRRRRLSLAGLCPCCGYDVRHCVDRCSECGAALAKTPQTYPSEPAA